MNVTRQLTVESLECRTLMAATVATVDLPASSFDEAREVARDFMVTAIQHVNHTMGTPRASQSFELGAAANQPGVREVAHLLVEFEDVADALRPLPLVPSQHAPAHTGLVAEGESSTTDGPSATLLSITYTLFDDARVAVEATLKVAESQLPIFDLLPIPEGPGSFDAPSHNEGVELGRVDDFFRGIGEPGSQDTVELNVSSPRSELTRDQSDRGTPPRPNGGSAPISQNVRHPQLLSLLGVVIDTLDDGQHPVVEQTVRGRDEGLAFEFLIGRDTTSVNTELAAAQADQLLDTSTTASLVGPVDWTMMPLVPPEMIYLAYGSPRTETRCASHELDSGDLLLANEQVFLPADEPRSGFEFELAVHVVSTVGNSDVPSLIAYDWLFVGGVAIVSWWRIVHVRQELSDCSTIRLNSLTLAKRSPD